MNIVSEFKYPKMISVVQLWADKLYTNWLKHKTAHSLNICSFFCNKLLILHICTYGYDLHSKTMKAVLRWLWQKVLVVQ